MQGKTRKSLRFLRAAGPLTGVLLGIAVVKIFHPSAISVVRTMNFMFELLGTPEDLFWKSIFKNQTLVTVATYSHTCVVVHGYIKQRQ